MSKSRFIIILLSTCFIISVVPFWSCYTVSAEKTESDYEIMRMAKQSEISSNLLTSMKRSGIVTDVNIEDKDKKVKPVYKMVTEEGGSNYLYQTVKSLQPGTYILSGWSKADSAERGVKTEYYSYALMASVFYTDGTNRNYCTMFSYGQHGWEYRETSFTLSQPIDCITVYAFFRAPVSGTAYFDDISFKCADDSSSLATFQDMPVKILKKSQNQSTNVTLETKNGLEMGLGDNQVTKLKIDGKSIMSDAYSGFLVRDIADESNSSVYGFKPDIGSKSDSFLGSQNTLGLELNADYKAKDDCITVNGEIKNTMQNKDDRAIQLSFALPVSANGWKWSTDILNEYDIKCGGASNVYKSVGEDVLTNVDWDSEPHSYYPTSVIYNEDIGIAIASSMDFPTYWELEYNGSTNSYVITYQLGITNESPDSARFDFTIYKIDEPKWGFRSATKQYSQIHPSYYVVNEKEHGMWLAWAQVDTVINVEDYNIKFKEIGGTSWLNGFNESQKGIKAYFYYELGDWWISQLQSADSKGLWEKINQLASLDEGDISDGKNRATLQAIATKFCKSLDYNGNITFNMVNNAWCPNGSQIHINANPLLPGKYNFYNLWMNEKIYKRLFDPIYSDGTTYNGIYIDELSGWWLGNANFNKEHYKYTTVPLTYSPYYKKAMLHRASTTWEAVKRLSDTLHNDNKTIFANKCPDKNAFYVPLVDAMGTEQGALNGTIYKPQTITKLSTWRTLAYSKPFCILLSNDFSIFNHEMMEKYFARCLTYAIFPSPCINSSDGSYYFRGQEKYYERDRDIFKTYMPAIKECSESGWEPITYAECDNGSLLVERYGENDTEGVHYVIYNPTSTDKDFSLKLELDKLDIGNNYQLDEMIYGENIELNDNTYTGHLKAESSICIRIKDPSKAVVDDKDSNGKDDNDNGNSKNNDGTITDSDKINTYKDNSYTLYDDSTNVGQAADATNKIIETTQGGLFKKLINHHLTNNLKKFYSKTTYQWTIVLIVVDSLILLSGVVILIMYRKKKKILQI